jgi:hypothetical protein
MSSMTMAYLFRVMVMLLINAVRHQPARERVASPEAPA